MQLNGSPESERSGNISRRWLSLAFLGALAIAGFSATKCNGGEPPPSAAPTSSLSSDGSTTLDAGGGTTGL